MFFNGLSNFHTFHKGTPGIFVNVAFWSPGSRLYFQRARPKTVRLSTRKPGNDKMSDMSRIDADNAAPVEDDLELLDAGDDDGLDEMFEDEGSAEPEAEEPGQEQEDEGETEDPKDPVDLFGDASITGAPVLERGTLPDVIWDFAEDNAEAIGTNPEAIASACLVAAATAIPAGWKIQPKLHDRRWTERPIIWSGLSGSSGANKSATLRTPFRPLFEIQKNWIRENKEALKEYNREMAIYRAQMAAAAKGECPFPEEPEKPRMRRLIVKDATVEKVMEICNDNPGGITQFRDEIAAWIGGFGKYKGSGDSEKATWLEAYNGDPASVDRMGRETHCEAFAVNVIGGIQDDVVRNRLSKVDADGFMARFLFVNPRPCFGEDFTANENAEKAYVDMLTRLLELEVPGPHGSWVVKMSEEAAEVGADLRRTRMMIQKLPTLNQGLSEHLSKWDGLWARLCLILHLIKFVTGQEGRAPIVDIMSQNGSSVITEARKVSKETAEQARDLLTKFYLPEAVRMYTEVLSKDDKMQHARWIAGHILAHGVKDISVYQIGRVYRPLAKDHRLLGETMKALELMGWLWEAGGKAAVGDFRKMKWKIHPRVHELFADRAKAEKSRRAKAVADVRAAKQAADRLRLGC